MTHEVFNSYKRKNNTDLFAIVEHSIEEFYNTTNEKKLEEAYYCLLEIGKRRAKKQLRTSDDFLLEELSSIASSKIIMKIIENNKKTNVRKPLNPKTIPAYFGKVVWGTVVDKQRKWYSKPKNGQRIYEISNLLHNSGIDDEEDFSEAIYFKYNNDNCLEANVDSELEKDDLFQKIEKKIKQIFNKVLLYFDESWKWVIISNAISGKNEKIFDKLPYRERITMKLISYEVKQYINNLSELGGGNAK